jgi:hypothetical protein
MLLLPGLKQGLIIHADGEGNKPQEERTRLPAWTPQKRAGDQLEDR